MPVVAPILRRSIYFMLISLLSISLIWGVAGAGDPLQNRTLIISARDLNIRGEIAHISFSAADPDILSFESIEGGTTHRLWTMHIPTGELKQISAHPDDLIYYGAQSDRNMSWCPVHINGKNWFLFVSNGSNDVENVYLGNTTDSLYLRLTSSYSVDHHPRWSPDCRSIVYVSSKTGNGDLYLITNTTRLISDFEQAVALSDSGNDDPELVVTGISEGINHKRITTAPDMDSYPEWSPDARYIVYQGLIRTDDIMHIDLFLYDTLNEGTEPLNLTNDPAWDYIQPQWSYDQQSIAFYMSASGTPDALRNSVYLSYLSLQDKLSTPPGRARHESVIDTNVRRSSNNGPFWGPGSRSLIYVKGDGNYTPILYFNAESDAPGRRPVVLHDSRIDIIHREVTGKVLQSDLRVAYLTYEEQDYRVYLTKPEIDLFVHRKDDVYIRPVPGGTKLRSIGIGANFVGIHSRLYPGMTSVNYLPEISAYYRIGFPGTGFPGGLDPTIRFTLGHLRTGYTTIDGGRRLFNYNFVELSALASVSIRSFGLPFRHFISAGIGYGFSSNYLLRTRSSGRWYVPFTVGSMIPIGDLFHIVPSFSIRRIAYSDGITRKVFSGSFGLGIMYRLDGVIR